ncbi:uncharacterized protein JCM10292_007023 [Rhodotorula paludigena]|uniref:uncharacterized protein n=1 Tax=Rhodotorula paludigena TaxID=86838 RepID=UPI00316CFCA1
MPDTDYDSLPSPPRSARGATAQDGTGKKAKLYGKRAARRGASAHASRARGGAEREAGSSSDAGSDARARKKTRDSAGKGRAKGGGRKGAARASKARRVERDEEGDVESNGDDEDEETLRPVKRASTRTRKDRLSAPKANKPPLSAPPPSTRANALLDKSNLTVQSPRRAGRTRPSQAPISSPSRLAFGSLSVFRDLLESTTSLLNLPGTSYQVPPTVSKASGSPPKRIPRAALARLAPKATLAPRSASPSLPRSPTSSGHASPRSTSAHRDAPRRPSSASALLGVPRPSLGGPPHSLPTPWALSAPVIDRSSSPFSPAPTTAADTSAPAQQKQPVFRYTTTEFGDLPSLRLSIDGCSDINPVAGGSVHGDAAMAEKEAEGMESTIVLETWDDEPSRMAAPSSVPDVVDPEQVDDEGEVTLKASDETVQAAERVEMDIDEHVHAPDAAEDATVVMTRPAAVLQDDDDDGLAAIETDGAQAAVDQDAETVAEPVILARELQSSSSGDAPGQARVAPKPAAPRTSYSAAFMPPRRPRPSVDVADPAGPPADEDELAYYLRTTGTFSSEDDLPPLSAAPSDESAAEDFLAERETGRAVKPTSGQRVKRLAASAEAREHRLRVGEGKDGRRKGLERVVLDLEDVRLSRRVRQAIEARAAGATAEDEERIQEEMKVQKREWRSG